MKTKCPGCEFRIATRHPEALAITVKCYVCEDTGVIILDRFQAFRQGQKYSSHHAMNFISELHARNHGCTFETKPAEISQNPGDLARHE